jgi:hypothetical protein
VKPGEKKEIWLIEATVTRGTCPYQKGRDTRRFKLVSNVTVFLYSNKTGEKMRIRERNNFIPTLIYTVSGVEVHRPT